MNTNRYMPLPTRIIIEADDLVEEMLQEIQSVRPLSRKETLSAASSCSKTNGWDRDAKFGPAGKPFNLPTKVKNVHDMRELQRYMAKIVIPARIADLIEPDAKPHIALVNPRVELVRTTRVGDHVVYVPLM